MRTLGRLLAAAGIVAATLSFSGTTASATTAAPLRAAAANCATNTDGHTVAWALCAISSKYQVVVDYCRVNCSEERGPCVNYPDYSRITFGPGGSIVVKAPELC